MPTAHDVAAYILEQQGPMTAMKLQKLVYYSQAWSLVWDDEPLFPEKIEAWINGPVVPELFARHKGQYILDSWEHGDANALDENQKETVDVVLSYYGDKSSHWLSDLTHSEEPWIEARNGLSPNDRGGNEITLDSMAWYYQSLAPNA